MGMGRKLAHRNLDHGKAQFEEAERLDPILIGKGHTSWQGEMNTRLAKILVLEYDDLVNIEQLPLKHQWAKNILGNQTTC